jgi:RNA polymerase sigma factor (sigma-70 family)
VGSGSTPDWRSLSAAELERRLSALLAEHSAPLARLAASYVRDAGDRDDLLQDIAVAIWRALPRFRGECSERTFLFRIAHNRGIAYITRRRVPVVDAEGELEVADARPNPEETLSTEQQGRRLLDAVQRLPVGHRQVVTLMLEGLSYGEIADVLGMTETNVGARLTRARTMLRRML